MSKVFIAYHITVQTGGTVDKVYMFVSTVTYFVIHVKPGHSDIRELSIFILIVVVEKVMNVLIDTLQTKAGNYIVKEYGVKELISVLNSVKHRVEADAYDIFQDVIDTIQFMSSVESETNVDVPRLALTSVVR